MERSYPQITQAPNPRTSKQTLKDLAIAAAQPHCAEQLRKWRKKKKKEGRKEGEGKGRVEKQNKINRTTNRTIEIKINKPITE